MHGASRSNWIRHLFSKRVYLVSCTSINKDASLDSSCHHVCISFVSWFLCWKGCLLGCPTVQSFHQRSCRFARPLFHNISSQDENLRNMGTSGCYPPTQPCPVGSICRHCAAAISVFCGQVAPGNANVISCLYHASSKREFPPECRLVAHIYTCACCMCLCMCVNTSSCTCIGMCGSAEPCQLLQGTVPFPCATSFYIHDALTIAYPHLAPFDKPAYNN